MLLHSIILGTLPNISIAGTTSTNTSITVNIGTIPSGIERVIIGYHRLNFGVPVVGEYTNNLDKSSRTLSSLVPGAKYMIMAWGIGGINDKSRSQSAALIEVTTTDQSKLMGMYMTNKHVHHLIILYVVYIGPSPPRDLTRTGVFDNGIELNWIPPSEPNGDIRHYIYSHHWS